MTVSVSITTTMLNLLNYGERMRYQAQGCSLPFATSGDYKCIIYLLHLVIRAHSFLQHGRVSAVYQEREKERGRG